MEHYYAVIPNNWSPANDEYCIDWCSVVEEGTYRVPTSRLFEDEYGNYFSMLTNGLNMPYERAVLVAKVMSEGKHPIYVYERLSNNPEDDNYWLFKQGDEIKIRKFLWKDTDNVIDELYLIEHILIKMTERNATREQINDNIVEALHMLIGRLAMKGYIREVE